MWNLSTKGEDNAMAKLDWAKVRKMRFLYKFGKASQQELSKRFNVAQTTVSKIVRNAAWNEYQNI